MTPPKKAKISDLSLNKYARLRIMNHQTHAAIRNSFAKTNMLMGAFLSRAKFGQ